MGSPVNRVTIHHEGAGAPTDNVGRFLPKGYSIGIGAHTYRLERPPWDSWATYGFNHVSLDICLSGNREEYPVTGEDLVLIRMAVSEARARGWLAPSPGVHPHKETGAKSGPTACPGRFTMERWPAVVSAVLGSAPAPVPVPVAPEEDEMTPEAVKMVVQAAMVELLEIQSDDPKNAAVRFRQGLRHQVKTAIAEERRESAT